ncbi:DUF2934 domain-containing protein [Caballeronia sp. GaOx3]|uniref:DUF2934 domain-containing protein n=1 Tax=Caballeronia sp. GaOx3 TaxID=2921740 RepID=UPI0020287A6A|nr:DUF2934 domain-containing protein [Caballeronia sp. GaOx3]
MEVPATEEQIRALAYTLWEEAGSPEGRSEEFWDEAKKQLGVLPAGSQTADESEEGRAVDMPASSERDETPAVATPNSTEKPG